MKMAFRIRPGLLSESPILPTPKAILLRWASPIPILVEMNDLTKKYRLKSDDPDFWDVWTGASNRDENWADIVNEWQGQTRMAVPLAESNNVIIEDQNNTEDDDLPF
jgi:hypothetical protein